MEEVLCGGTGIWGKRYLKAQAFGEIGTKRNRYLEEQEYAGRNNNLAEKVV